MAQETIPTGILKNLIFMSVLINMGSSLSHAWECIIAGTDDSETKEFFESMKRNWEALPPDEGIRVFPTFVPYENASEEWRILSDLTKTGEGMGALHEFWRVGVTLILMKRKLSKGEPESADMQLFQALGPFMNGVRANWQKWSLLPAWKEQTLSSMETYNDQLYKHSLVAWIAAEKGRVTKEALVPGYIEEEIKAITARQGIPDEAPYMIGIVRDFWTIII